MYDLIIIGAGPAGLTAGIYAKRANLKVAVVESGPPGGQLVSTGHVENYPGFFKIAGADLGIEMFNQGLNLGVKYYFNEVKEIKDGRINGVVLLDKTLKTTTIISATGAIPRKLGLPNEEKLSGKNISWCAVCDGPLYQGKDVVVVGGGNSAVEEASYLAGIVNKITIIQNLDTLTADQIAIDNLLKHDNVKIYYESLVTAFLLKEDESFLGVEIEIKKSEKQIIEADGVFEYVGLKPSTTNFKNLAILNEYGYIKTNDKMETTLRGVYAAGDVREKQIRQVVTAANDGAIAALSALRYIETWK